MRHAIILRKFWVLLKSNRRTILLVIKLIKNNLIPFSDVGKINENEEMIVAVNTAYAIEERSLKKNSELQRGLNP